VIIRGELQDSHKERLAALERPVNVNVVPRGVTAPGLRVFRALAKAFKRHRFLMVVRDDDLDDPEVKKIWESLRGIPNVYVDTVEGGHRGIEIARRYAKLEKRAAEAAKLETG
jgi:hypothetical protein